MNKFICTMLIILGILGNLCAQHQFAASVNKKLSISPDYIDRRFWIDLGKGNRLCLELEDGQDLEIFSNIDSLLMVFMTDMKPFADSMSDPLSWHVIDYLVDAAGKKRVRLQSFHPQYSSYLLDQPDPAILRLEQDTIQIILEHAASTGRNHDGIRQDRLSLYLNNYHEISSYITGGLNEKMRWLQKNVNKYWVREKYGFRAEKDPSITSYLPAGYVAMANDQLATVVQVNMGNYKNYFSPSFSLGLAASFRRENGTRIFSVLWHPTFLFGTNAQGHLQTSRNDFLFFNIWRDGKNANQFYINLTPSFTFGWLIHREGDYFQKNSYYLGIGHINLLKQSLVLQPGFYFHDLFREVTPGITLNVNL